MKRRRKSRPSPEDSRSCSGKRVYRSQGDALDAAACLGMERQRTAYHCPVCHRWHLTSR